MSFHIEANKGEIAERIVKFSKANGGRFSMRDFHISIENQKIQFTMRPEITRPVEALYHV